MTSAYTYEFADTEWDYFPNDPAVNQYRVNFLENGKVIIHVDCANVEDTTFFLSLWVSDEYRNGKWLDVIFRDDLQDIPYGTSNRVVVNLTEDVARAYDRLVSEIDRTGGYGRTAYLTGAISAVLPPKTI